MGCSSNCYDPTAKGCFMKIFLLIFVVVLSLTGKAQTKTEYKRFIVGGHVVNRNIRGYNYLYIYPRLSFEYNVSKTSSFEFLAEYINHKPTGTQVISYPLSVGYKLNILPWFIKNDEFTDKLKIYNSFRYTLLLSPEDANSAFSNLRVFHYFRYAPGIDFFFNKNWGFNYEMVFGENMKTTMALGVKFRF